MTTLPLFQKCLVAVCLTGVTGCLAAIFACRFRSELKELHAKWIGTSPLTRALCILALTLGVLYGGTKPPASTNEPPGSVSGETTTTNEPPVIVDGDDTNAPPDIVDGDTPTNDPPDIVEGDAPTNDPPVIVEGDAPTNTPPDTAEGDAPTNAPPPVLMAGRPRPALMMPPPSQTSQSSPTVIANWTARGAWIDWHHIAFPESFSFPVGTNMLFGVTLMSFGDVRERLANPAPLVSLPSPVSLEPDVSSCAYGLTASNSFLIAWSNVCVERNPTNRVDASIELFDSGDMTVRFGDTVTNIVARPPDGFVGEAQDEDWLAAAFPGDYASITNDGYEAWIDDYVGHNEPNGLYKCFVTVNALPEHGPCYLVCGPYKMVVKEPGEYCFPLMDFIEYDLYTCPTAVPLTYYDDDGWDLPASDYMPLLMSPAPRRLLGAPRNDDHHYKIQRFPEVFVHPNYLSHDEAIGEMITVSCNAAGIAVRNYTSASGRARLYYTSPSTAEIIEADIQDAIYISFEYNGLSTCGTVTINPPTCPWWPYCPGWPDCPYHYDPSPNSTNDTSNASTP